MGYPLLLFFFLLHAVAEELSWHPLRIHVHYDSSVAALCAKQELKSAVESAVDFWQKALHVRRITEPTRRLHVSRPSCAIDMAPESLERLDVHSLASEMILADRYGAMETSCDAATDCMGVLVPEQHLMPCVQCPSAEYINGTRNYDQCTINGNTKFSPEAFAAAAEEAGTGVDADYILYVAVNDLVCQQGAIATGTMCKTGGRWNRPTAGRVLICTRATTDETLLKHEIIHALGFVGPATKGFWKDDHTPYYKIHPTNPRMLLGGEEGQVVRTVTRDDWLTKNGKISHSVSMVTSPLVVKEAQKHFNCSTLEGLELENSGAWISRHHHWEQRLMFEDIIQSSPGQNNTVSRITLAFLEDSGWYKANYSMAGKQTFGLNHGCDFVKKSCGEWIKTRRSKGLSPAPFCDRPTNGKQYMGCSFSRKSVGRCGTNTRVPVPVEFQYFEGYSGTNAFMDYCPYVSDTTKSTSCLKVNGGTHFGQTTGPDSHCIDYSGEWVVEGEIRTDKNITVDMLLKQYSIEGGCYKTQCANSQLYIEIAGQWHICSPEDEGKKIKVEIKSGHATARGVLVCPRYTDICTIVSFHFAPGTLYTLIVCAVFILFTTVAVFIIRRLTAPPTKTTPTKPSSQSISHSS